MNFTRLGCKLSKLGIKGVYFETNVKIRILLKLFQALKVFKLNGFLYMQNLMIFIDVSKIILVHFEEVLKDLHAKKGELLERGLD